MSRIRITGQVLYADLSAAPDASVRIVDAGANSARLWAGTTDGAGKFECHFHWPSTVFLPLLAFLVTDHQDQDRHHTGPWLTAGGGSVPILVPWLQAPAPQAQFTGEVRSVPPANQPMANVDLKFCAVDVLGRLVTLPSCTARTARNGTFTCGFQIESAGLLPWSMLKFTASKGNDRWAGLFLPFAPSPRIIWVPWGVDPTAWYIKDHGPDVHRGRHLPSNARSAVSMFNFASVEATNGRHHSYRDSGHRYEFRLRNGRVEYRHSPPGWAPPADDWQPFRALSNAKSYHKRRRGEPIPVPRFDLLAANGNRLLAKEEGTDRLFFALIDEIFLHQLRGDDVVVGTASQSIPGIFFKLDPEAGTVGRNVNDLLEPLKEEPPRQYNDHPATIRFAAYRWAMRLNDAAPGLVAQRTMMPVRKQVGTWYQIDARPSPGNIDGLPVGVPTYQHVLYGNALLPSWTQEGRSIALASILDVGVGSVHLHESYSEVYGGEIQPLLFRAGSFRAWMYFYQLFNGQVRDGDGFVDGTCNYYLLGRLQGEPGTPGRHALLYLDEQSGPSGRWQLVGVREPKPPMFSLPAALADPVQAHLYAFDKRAFWDPFEAGCIADPSRMSVARQMIAISGVDDGRHEVYTINFSWGTTDKTWRVRPMPFGTVAEIVATPAPPGQRGPDAAELGWDANATGGEPDQVREATGKLGVMPQSVLIRDDSTLVIKGLGRIGTGRTATTLRGRYYQKLLPSDLSMPEPVPDAKPAPFTHAWRFVPETVFQRMDLHSHLGVYEPVDGRSQYYPLKFEQADLDRFRASNSDEAIWEDVDKVLSVRCPRVPFEALDEAGMNDRFSEFCSDWGATVDQITRSGSLDAFVQCLVNRYVSATSGDRRPSQFNPRTLLRVRELPSVGVIATYWDKRDDDLVPLTLPPGPVRLRKVGANVNVKAWFSGPPVQVLTPPLVRRATLALVPPRWSGRSRGRARTFEVSFELPEVIRGPRPVGDLEQRGREILRVVAAYIDPQSGQVHRPVDLLRAEHFQMLHGGSTYRYRFEPSADTVRVLMRHFSQTGSVRSGATIYFENVVGLKNTAEELIFQC